MNRSKLVFSLVALCIGACGAGGPGRHRTGSSQDAIERIEREIDAIASQESARIAGGEITVARVWIEDGKRAIAAGRFSRAERVAKRLGAEMALIRSLAAAGQDQALAEQTEADIFALEQRVKELGARRDILTLRLHGAELTGAFLPLEGAAP